ncbi:MAG: 50S ribosomal protein L35 [Dehalococcoidales bacterium]|nr:50S ribosomal protein L35 [Dehalococcoidales bacterium]
MPKLKTHKGAKSRFMMTGTGKIMRIKGPKSHLRRNKAKRVRKQFDEKIQLNAADKKRISRLIPYGVK